MIAALEAKVQKLEDRLALQDLIVRYCTEIDKANLDGVMSCFSENALLDLSGLGLPIFKGKGAIRDFFASVFKGTLHNGHYSTNFKIHSLSANNAQCESYVFAVGIAADGRDILVHAKHQFGCVKEHEQWLIAHFTEPYLVPPKVSTIPDFD